MTAAHLLYQQGAAAQAASSVLARLPTCAKNHALQNLASVLETEQSAVLEANAADYRDAQYAGISDAFWTACCSPRTA